MDSEMNWRELEQRGVGREGSTAGSPASRAVGPSLPDRLRDLAHHVQRLSPSHRDPERFHEDKSEIVAELRRLARVTL